MSIARLAVLACLIAWPASFTSAAQAAPVCRATVVRSLALPGRADSLLALGGGAGVVALVGKPGSPIRFLPHDTLDLLRLDGSAETVQSIDLPAYVIPPGLASGPSGKQLYLVLDSQLLTLDGTSGRLAARQDLALRPIGWPAAVTTGANGDIYLVGQPPGAMEAQLYAFRPAGGGVLRLRWSQRLGLTHAGTWVGPAGHGLLAVYMPDQSDFQGTIALFAAASGSLVRTYAVTSPPAAASPALNRLYQAGAGTVAAFALASGAPEAKVSGDGPLAVNEAQGLVAFVRAGYLVVARASDLRPLLTIAFPSGLVPTALAWQPSALVVGNAHEITQVRLDTCQGG